MGVIAVLLVVVAVISSHPAAASSDTAAPAPAPVLPPLAARLHRAFSITLDDDGAGGGIMECWDALVQLGSCTSEVVNGEPYIGPECCRAIRGATRHCWPAMLASVGFSAEQADVLRGFCEGEAAAQQQGGGSSVPPPTPAGNSDAPPPAGN